MEPDLMWVVAERVAESIRNSAGVPASTRIHLHAAARGLGVRSVTVTELAVGGLVRWSDGMPDIWIRQDMPDTRRRSSLAHELAHVALDQRPEAYRSNGTHAEERLCNAVAAELLIPAAGLRDWTSHEPLTLASLSRYADDLSVSRGALVRRLAEAAKVECLLVDLAKSQWMEGWLVGSEVYGRLLCSRPTRAPRLVMEDPCPDEADGGRRIRVWYEGLGYDCTASLQAGRERGHSRSAWALLKDFQRRPNLDQAEPPSSPSRQP